MQKPKITIRKMKVIEAPEFHPSLGRRGVVVPYDIPLDFPKLDETQVALLQALIWLKGIERGNFR
jgi:hypothetical protein